MALSKIQAVILAAGKSSRFKTGKTKLIEKICGQEMIVYPVALCVETKIPVTVIVGFQKETVKKAIKKEFGSSSTITFAEQKEQRGTGHALEISAPFWKEDHILVINGDIPLVTQEIVEELYAKHITTHAVISFVTAHNCEPTAASYGRVVTDKNSIAIIEAKEFTGDLTENCCVNAGIYLIKRSFIEDNIKKLQKSSITGEWYITDLVKIASDKKLHIEMIAAPFDKIRGVNTFKELWAVEQILKAEIIKNWMDNGVRFTIAHNVQIDKAVIIEPGVAIGSGVQLLGNTHIEKNAIVEAFSIIKSSIIKQGAIIEPHCVISDSVINKKASVGPFAHIKGKSSIGQEATVGNFVEINRSSLGKASKAKHLSYLGDTTIGESCNIGAGTITCNYDGVEKFKTIIEDEVFVGSNNTLVAPLIIKKNAYTAAGSTITENVPSHALAIARQRQTNKPDYAKKLKTKQTDKQKKSKTQNNAHAFLAATKSNQFETP